MEWLSLLGDPSTWAALASLVAMEIVLGIDNVVFVSVLTSGLSPNERAQATRLGLGLAVVMRVALLFALSWVLGLTTPLFSVLGHTFAGKHLVLLAGGLFLVAKATKEIHAATEADAHAPARPRAGSKWMIVGQIAALDAVFSLDSVITAVGMVDAIAVMVVAVLIAVGAMLAFAAPVSAFVERHPTTKMLALAFLILVGVVLVAEGLGQHVPKGYVYFAMAFSLAVELLNLRSRRQREEARAHERAVRSSAEEPSNHFLGSSLRPSHSAGAAPAALQVLRDEQSCQPSG